MTLPATYDPRIEEVMRATGMDRVQAWRHLCQRDALAAKLRHNRGRW